MKKRINLWYFGRAIIALPVAVSAVVSSNADFMRLQFTTFAVFAISCFSSTLFAQGNLVVNGNFDSNANGWVLTNGAKWQTDKQSPGGRLTLDSGLEYPLAPPPNELPTALQLLTGLLPSQIYSISGQYEKIDDGYGTSFGVAVDNIFFFQSGTPADYSYHTFNFFYTASTPTALLSISAELNNISVPYFIENISITPVPEPSALCLWLLGGGVLVYSRKQLCQGHSKQ